MSNTTHISLRPSLDSLWYGGLRVCSVLALTACCGSIPSYASELDSTTTATLQMASAGSKEGPIGDLPGRRLLDLTCESVPPVPAPNSNAIRVTDFGAVPNDGLDDTASIQAALNAANSGQWVIFPKGHYLHNRSLQIMKSGVTLFGSGATLHATNPSDQSVMLKADNTRMYGFNLTAVTKGRLTKAETARITAWGADNLKRHIFGVVIQGNTITPASKTPGNELSNSASSAGILFVSVRDFTVANNTVERSLADGIHVSGSSSNGRILENVVRETGDDGIAVVSYLNKAFRSEMTNSSSWFSSIGTLSRVQNVVIAKNDVSGQYWGRGIAVVGGADITIRGNKVSRIAMAAGILIAREHSYETHGVTNVLVESNDISSIQTEKPGYTPTGEFFANLEAKTAINGGRTGHAGIEVNNTSLRSDATSDMLLPAIKISKVVITNNKISDVIRNAIRVGADSHAGTIEEVSVIQNAMNKAGSAPMVASFNGGLPIHVSCLANTYEGAESSFKSCSYPSNQQTTGLGASLNCNTLSSPPSPPFQLFLSGSGSVNILSDNPSAVR